MDNQPFNRLWIYQKLFRRSWHTILNDSFRWWWQWLYWKHEGSFWLFSLLSLQIVSFSRENDFTKSSSSLEEDAGSGFEEDCGRIACSENWDVGLEYILQHTQRTMHRHRKVFYLRLSKCNRLWLRRWALTRLDVTLKIQLEPCHVILLCHDLLRIFDFTKFEGSFRQNFMDGVRPSPVRCHLQTFFWMLLTVQEQYKWTHFVLCLVLTVLRIIVLLLPWLCFCNVLQGFLPYSDHPFCSLI